MSLSKPPLLPVKPPACPVCGKPSYSRGGVHPQCAVARADKVRKLKTPPKPKTAVLGQWKKRCPRCNRELPARRYSCECGHKFETPASG
jgi:hypothetical protein